jgi:hypothetical protein
MKERCFEWSQTHQNTVGKGSQKERMERHTTSVEERKREEVRERKKVMREKEEMGGR